MLRQAVACWPSGSLLPAGRPQCRLLQFWEAAVRCGGAVGAGEEAGEAGEAREQASSLSADLPSRLLLLCGRGREGGRRGANRGANNKKKCVH